MFFRNFPFPKKRTSSFNESFQKPSNFSLSRLPRITPTETHFKAFNSFLLRLLPFYQLLRMWKSLVCEAFTRNVVKNHPIAEAREYFCCDRRGVWEDSKQTRVSNNNQVNNSNENMRVESRWCSVLVINCESFCRPTKIYSTLASMK